MKQINLGAGNNPKPGAINVDVGKNLPVDVRADVNHLPFKEETFDDAISINPFGFNPVHPETARILKPGSILTVAAQPVNPFFRKFLKNATPEEIRSLGFEFIERGPAAEVFKFGTPRRTTGQELSTHVFIQAIFRRLP